MDIAKMCGCGELVEDLQDHFRCCGWAISALKVELSQEQRREVSALYEQLRGLKTIALQDYQDN
jgi:hypothetical protein